MKKCLAIVLISMLLLGGCGNVYLRGQALTSAETSTVHAYIAVQKAEADPNTPSVITAYLRENFEQWRSFVRSARKDTNWGPMLPGE